MVSISTLRPLEFLDVVNRYRYVCALLYAPFMENTIYFDKAKQSLNLAAVQKPMFNFYLVCVESDSDYELLQICKFPQFRIYVKGSERNSIIGSSNIIDLMNNIDE